MDAPAISTKTGDVDERVAPAQPVEGGQEEERDVHPDRDAGQPKAEQRPAGRHHGQGHPLTVTRRRGGCAVGAAVRRSA
jgi:hypothetical protein